MESTEQRKGKDNQELNTEKRIRKSYSRKQKSAMKKTKNKSKRGSETMDKKRLNVNVGQL